MLPKPSAADVVTQALALDDAAAGRSPSMSPAPAVRSLLSLMTSGRRGRSDESDLLTCSLQLEKRTRSVDFVLLSEFSELEGPVPLFRIPESAAPNFQANDFVLRYVLALLLASMSYIHVSLLVQFFGRLFRV